MSSARSSQTRTATPGQLAALERAELLWVEGEDAQSFLGGLLSNDVAELGDGESQRSLLLDAKGRVRAVLRVRRDGEDAFTLVLRAGAGAQMLADLERYHFSERLDVLGPEPVQTLVVEAEDASRLVQLAELDVVGWVPGTVELALVDPVSALGSAALAPSPPNALDALRIETGTPLPVRDFGETALVHELGLERTAVSFTKGCYLGQETVARVEHRGKVNRRLRAVLLEEEVAEGCPVTLDGAGVGSLGTVAQLESGQWAALSVLRSVAQPGSEVAIDGRTGHVRAVPLAT